MMKVTCSDMLFSFTCNLLYASPWCGCHGWLGLTKTISIPLLSLCHQHPHRILWKVYLHCQLPLKFLPSVEVNNTNYHTFYTIRNKCHKPIVLIPHTPSGSVACHTSNVCVVCVCVWVCVCVCVLDQSLSFTSLKYSGVRATKVKLFLRYGLKVKKCLSFLLPKKQKHITVQQTGGKDSFTGLQAGCFFFFFTTYQRTTPLGLSSFSSTS